MRLDHVVLACPGGLEAADEWLLRNFGIPTLPGGEHPSFGTANRIVPLADGSYLELAAVVDADVAAGTTFGRLVAQGSRARAEGDPAKPAVGWTDRRSVGRRDRRSGGPTDGPAEGPTDGPAEGPTDGPADGRPVPVAWCVAVDDLDGECARLGLAPLPASRTRPDGVTLNWRLAGLEGAAATPYLPFLIEWDVPREQHPAAAPYDGPRLTVVELRLNGDQASLTAWLDGRLERLPVAVASGTSGVRACVIEVDGRTIVV